MDLEYSKITISASLVEFLGYELGLDWEAQKGSIALPKQKRDMVCSMIQDARRGGSITRADLEVLLGRLNFACQLVVEHKPRLAGLYAALAMMNKLELRKRTIGGVLEQDMVYFYDILSRPLVMEPALMVESQWSIVTDGCLHGIGGLVVGPDESTQAWFSISRSDYPQLWKELLLLKRKWGGYQHQHSGLDQYVPSEVAERAVSGDICFIEAIAAACGILAVERLLGVRDPSRVRVRCFSDNRAVSSLIRRWTSKTEAMRNVLGWLYSWAGRVSSCFIPGRYNTVADKLSRSDRKDIVGEVPRGWFEVEVSDQLRSCINAGYGG
ncbi:hypothetical protein FOL47_002005 [Perkinsus chesapeaki]|uniref:Uncharacterized protein n=1 Tax=Perkinsus chesapeaki TaxID=330153 RepID=A0A7J6KRQ7_PERCH|nr:hypothetical protein FOL47_002005 [Perkinsus chesapeaki]